MKNNTFRWFFSIAALEGLAVLAWIVLIPSGTGRAYLFGLSKLRLALFAFTCVAWLVSLWAAYQAMRSPDGLSRIRRFFDDQLLRAGHLVPAVLSLAILTLLGLASILWTVSLSPQAIAFYTGWLGARFSVLNGLFNRGLPVLTWFTALSLQAMVWTLCEYADTLRSRNCWRWGAVSGTLLFWLIAILTLAHWAILVLGLRALASIPGWYWRTAVKPFTVRDALFIVLFAALMAVAYRFYKKPKAVRPNLLLLCVLMVSVQLSMGIIDGKGVESLREKYFSSLHKSYAVKATTRNDSVLESIRSYEAVYSNMLFPSTKPPGVMAIYIGMERTINGVTHLADSQARFAQLSGFIAWTFPVLSVSALFLIYFYARRVVYPIAEAALAPAYLSCLLYAFAPNIALLVLFLDQAFYPALFLTGALLVVFAFRRGSLWLAFLMGCFLYLAIFFSFSMLPLFAFAVLYGVVVFWTNPEKRWLGKEARVLVAAGLGVVFLFVVFRVVLNYDFFARYQNAMSVVYTVDFYDRVNMKAGGPITILQRAGQILMAISLNNPEFATAVSIPVFVLFVIRGIKSVVLTLRRMAAPGDGVQADFFLTYAALNVYGQMRGEAARLWMFWVPVVVLLAGIEITALARRKPAYAFALLAAQFITLVLTFQFQDLHM